MSEQPRIPPVAAGTLEPPLGSLNIARTVAQNPALMAAWGGFATYILGPDLSITPRERELAILRVGWNQQASYEWAHHVAIAEEIGMSDEDILAIQDGPGSAHWREQESLILEAADELWREREISAATWDGLKRYYSDQQMLDLLFTMGQYTLVSMALKSLKVQLEEGFEGL
jgi:4-carboxymuconolactone decarboxylase